MNNQPQIILKNVSKKYKLFSSRTDRLSEAFNPFGSRKHKEFFAIHNLNLVINKGEIVGVIGRNGSGKSTLLKMVAGITQPTSGTVEVRDNVVPLLELGTGFHPDLTGRDNIYFYTTLLGYEKSDIRKIIDEVIGFAEVGEFIDQPLKSYSSGMKARLAFSVSIYIDPDILIVDEVLAVGDEYFKEKSLNKMHELFKSGRTILFVSHSASAITELCTRAILLNKGEMAFQGDPEEVITYYREHFIKSAANKKESKRMDIINNEQTINFYSTE